MICPGCHTDLDGGLIYETFLAQGNTPEQAKVSAEMYGATETEGRWGRAIGIYSREQDKTVGWLCPDCGHLWERK